MSQYTLPMHSWEGDPNQPATREYGKVGPGSDLTPDRSIDPHAGSWRILFAVIAGVVLAAVVATASATGMLPSIAQLLKKRDQAPRAQHRGVLSGQELVQLEQETPQNQAQILLEQAVSQHEWAIDQIESRVRGWQGKVQLTPKLNS